MFVSMVVCDNIVPSTVHQMYVQLFMASFHRDILSGIFMFCFVLFCFLNLEKVPSACERSEVYQRWRHSRDDSGQSQQQTGCWCKFSKMKKMLMSLFVLPMNIRILYISMKCLLCDVHSWPLINAVNMTYMNRQRKLITPFLCLCRGCTGRRVKTWSTTTHSVASFLRWFRPSSMPWTSVR